MGLSLIILDHILLFFFFGCPCSILHGLTCFFLLFCCKFCIILFLSNLYLKICASLCLKQRYSHTFNFFTSDSGKEEEMDRRMEGLPPGIIRVLQLPVVCRQTWEGERWNFQFTGTDVSTLTSSHGIWMITEKGGKENQRPRQLKDLRWSSELGVEPLIQRIHISQPCPQVSLF